MRTRVIPTSSSSSHDKVGHIAQSILTRCEMQRFVAFHGPCKDFSSRSCVVRIALGCSAQTVVACWRLAHRGTGKQEPIGGGQADVTGQTR
jgi:hypothetical protein